jgi:hypothetical protein
MFLHEISDLYHSVAVYGITAVLGALIGLGAHLVSENGKVTPHVITYLAVGAALGVIILPMVFAALDGWWHQPN